jgi:hypothetical protein
VTLADFDKAFSGALGRTQRWQAFTLIAEDLISRDRPLYIIETGCARQVGNWNGDGLSTVLWDWLITRTGGRSVTYEINHKNILEGRKMVSKAEIVQCDSVVGLRNTENPDTIDLLYLDSYDLTETIDSPLHHLAELASIYAQLPSGCLIAIDDCVDEQHGKHRFVRDFLSRLGVEPVLRSYITVWRKP